MEHASTLIVTHNIPPYSDILSLPGKARLKVYGTCGSPILIIPSLINKSYILNFYDESLVQYLAQNHIVYLLDWGEIDEDSQEADFSLHNYIQGILCVALDEVYKQHNTKVALMGYCFGGNLALLLATQRTNIISKITTMGMPFDFHKSGYFPVCTTQFGNIIPKDFVRNYFYIRSFESINTKYIDGFSSEIAIKIEHWSNDTINLSKKAYIDIKENLLLRNSMYENNTLTSGNTEYHLDTISDIEIVNIVATYDKIVPLACVNQKLGKLKQLDTGHTGLVMARNFRTL